ncbi:SusC/RagA family TonB-linked outer membrane protein [Sphingobacterium spiritivorum]|uniref:SusC/RagA family TonB-linked outer membrane protein n=1 Tax=Sphingobacterium spiritivorum TaxID=258 RepID=UPI003F758924
MRKTNYYLKLMGSLLFLQLCVQKTIAAENQQNREIGPVISKIEKKLNIRFGYDTGIGHLKIKDDTDLKNLKKDNLNAFIMEISYDQLQVSQVDNMLFVLSRKHEQKKKGTSTGFQKITVHADQKILKGEIIDQETKAKIAGVTVRVKGTDKVTTTDNNGIFSIEEVAPGAILVVSSLGYRTVEIPADQAAQIELNRSSEELQEVVVTALGIKREKRALGYAVQEIKGDDLQKVKGVDVGTTLTGRISGLRVFNSTEFNKMPSITLRGMDPILVIDGVLYENMNLRDIPVDNIENINVLKGATATALYGERGAGGAIMVTTKKGLKSKGTEISVSTNNMFFSGYLALPSVQSSYSAGYGGKFNTDDEVWGDKLDIGRRYQQWNPITKQLEESELVSKGKNNFKNFLEPGFISNNSVSFTNQGENGSITTSISHVYNKGQYPNTKLNMTNISVSGETKITEKLNLESRFGYNRRNTPNDFGAGYNAQGYIYNILVWTGPEYDLSQYKDYWIVKNEKQNWNYNAWYDNPYLSAYEKISAELINKLNAAITLNYQVTDWGKLVLRSGYDYYGNTQEQTNPMGIYGTRGGFSGYDNRGKYWTRKQDGFSTNNDLIFTAKKPFGDFGIDGLLGGAVFYRRNNTLTASTVNGLAIPGFYSLRNSVGPVSSVESKIKEMTNSVYGRLSLSWRNLIFLEATGRNDWSSTLPKENRSYFYPSLSGSVVVSDLFEKPQWLNLLKVRGSQAVTKQILDPYEINQAFTVTANVWDGLSTGSYPNSIKDFSISPTQRDLTEVGLDFSVLNNRLYGDYTRYYRREHNAITSATISGATGFTSRLINTKEETMTKGHEITIGGTPVKKEHFQWDISGNLSQNLKYYHKLDPDYSADALYVKVGERTDHYVTRDWERSPDGQIVHNASGMPISAVHESRLFGYTAPKWIWGLTNNFRYHDFALSFSLDGRIKGLSYSSMNARLWQTGAHPDSDSPERYEEVVNGNKTYIGQGVKIVSGNVTYDKYGQIVTDTRQFAANDKTVSYESYWKRAYSGTRNIWDETFIKLREISLSYYLPAEVAARFKAKRASVGVTGQNLFLWTKEYRFSDPDVGSEDLNSPSMRYIGFNINVSF